MLQDWKLMRSGVAAFNGVLVGIGLTAITPSLIHDDHLQPAVLAFVCVGSFIRWVLHLRDALVVWSWLSRVRKTMGCVPENVFEVSAYRRRNLSLSSATHAIKEPQ